MKALLVIGNNYTYNENDFKDFYSKLDDGALVFLDLDNLKYVNDSLGHESGDIYIKRFVDYVKKELSMREHLYRYGGDEFIILLNTSESDVADKCIENINKNLEYANKFSKRPYEVSVSIGYGFFDMKQIGLDELLEVIEGKMREEKKKYYMAHDRRKNRVDN